MATVPRLVRLPDRLGLSSFPFVALLTLGLTMSLANLASAPAIDRSVARVATSPNPLAWSAHAVASETVERRSRQRPIAATGISKIAGERGERHDASADPLTRILASFAAAHLDPVLVGAGDIADCTTGADMATARLVEGIPGIVFTAGDEAYPEGSAENFRDCYDPSWGRFLDRTLPAVGNHEYGTAGAAGYYGYFGSDGSGGWPSGHAWYSLQVGTWHVVVLDSDCDIVGCGRRSPQLAWLKADLAGHPARCTLAIWHHPRFSSGGHGNDPAVAPFWRALMRAGAELVINGHDHDYERFAPQTPGGRLDHEDGIREIVAGTGGAHLRRFHRTKPNSRLRLRTYGVLRLTLHPASYSWRFVRTDGSSADAGTTACH